jgi:predicted dehydrogenase
MLSMNALEKSGMYELAAMADLREEVREKCKARFPNISTYSSHREMLEDGELDIVCVSTYPPSHEEVTMDALKLPLKGILVEKPLGHTAASGRRILEAIKAKGIPVVVPHGLLAKKTPQTVIELVRQGAIGKLKSVDIQNDKWDIINAGIHWLQFCVQLTDCEPIDYVMAICEGSTRTFRDGMQVETTAVTYVQTVSGIRFIMNTGDDVLVNVPGKSCLFRVIGDAGMIEFYGWENGCRIVNCEHPLGEWIVPQELPVTGHQFYLEQLARMAESGQFDSRIADSSLMALELCEGAYLSSRHQCKVKFPFNAEAISSIQWEMGVPYSGTGGGRDGRKL